MISAEVIETIQEKYDTFVPYMDERTCRIWAAIEARALGYGGVMTVARATGLSRNTIAAGMRELKSSGTIEQSEPKSWFIRRPGGGRKRVEEKDPSVLEALESLVEPMSRGDPQSP